MHQRMQKDRFQDVGNFYYTVMLFGLTNAATTYQRAITTFFMISYMIAQTIMLIILL